MAATELQQAIVAEEALSVDLLSYIGQWVAVRDHRVLGHADTLDNLLEQVEAEVPSLERIFKVVEPSRLLNLAITEDELDGGYVVECVNLPGCMSQGETVEEAFANIGEAIGGVLAARDRRVAPLPKSP